MKKIICIIWCAFFLCGFNIFSQTFPQTDNNDKQIVIAASIILDGKGNKIKNTRIVIKNGLITAIDPKAKPVDYDLRGYTVMPGWIDAHTHISSVFGEDGKYLGTDTTRWGMLGAISNAYHTLIGGFTTIQSVGSNYDTELRDAIQKGLIVGPRILTSRDPIIPTEETPEWLRAFVKAKKEKGADLIKIMIESLKDPAKQSAQLNALCDEAQKQGLRAVVHANGQAVRLVVSAGCTQVEHGRNATQEDLEFVVEKGLYFDPQAGFLMENYYINRLKFVGTQYFQLSEEEMMKKYSALVLKDHELIKLAAKVKGLKIVFGSDALPGMHGKNSEEFIHRVEHGKMDNMRALISANSLGAEALGLSDSIGSIAQGLQADIIAIKGDPLKDIKAVRNVVFVMKGGTVHKNLT